MTSTKSNLLKYFLVSDRFLLQGLFSEWKDLFRVSKHNNDVKNSNSLRSHEASMYESHMSSMNQRITDINTNFGQEQELTHANYAEKIKKLKEEHKAEMETAKEGNAKLYQDLMTSRQNEKAIHYMFLQAQRFVNVIQETVNQFPPNAFDEADRS